MGFHLALHILGRDKDNTGPTLVSQGDFLGPLTKPNPLFIPETGPMWLVWAGPVEALTRPKIFAIRDIALRISIYLFESQCSLKQM